MKRLLKKITPQWLRNLRHLYFAWRGAVKYDHPSEELVVVGITGTSGKSSSAYFLCQILEAAGRSVGSLSTIDFRIAGQSKLNDQKMTMLGRMQIQKFLRQMADARCDIAIIETTSEGRVQYRHRFINYDIMALTNFYPEHIESHGSLEKYKQAKIDLFMYVAASKRKRLNGKTIPKQAIAFDDNTHARAEEFLAFPFDRRYIFSEQTKLKQRHEIDYDFVLYDYESHENGQSVCLDDVKLFTNLRGKHNLLNVCLAALIARSLGVPWTTIIDAAGKLKSAPGRIEHIPEAETYGFSVIVDYAFEPVALSTLYATIAELHPRRIIHVSGNAGGGRDKPDKKAVFLAQHADIVVVTNEDPYDDDPLEIINYMADIIAANGKEDGKKLFRVVDREAGIQKAIDLAEPGDIVLVTGKGSEQGMCVAGGKMLPWDDRTAVRNALRRRRKNGAAALK